MSSQNEQSNQPSQLINDCNLTQCNSINSAESNNHLQSVHLNVHSSNQLNSISSHQILNQSGAPNHYMIHVTNTNNQESQITIEPMTNGIQPRLHTNNCTFTTNDITQLTSLNGTNNEVCLEGSNINLTTLNNSQLSENCLLSSDGDICWNTLLTDELRLVDTIDSYSNTVPLTAVPITNQTTNQVMDSQTNSIQGNSSINSLTNSSVTNTIVNPVTNPVISNSQITNSSNLLTNTQNQNLIHNPSTTTTSTSSNQTNTTNYCCATTNQFTNQIDSNIMNNHQMIHSSQVMPTKHELNNCVDSQSNSPTINQHNNQLTNSWNGNVNYMNLSYNQLNGNVTEQSINNGTSTSQPLNNSSSNINTTSLTDNNHDSPLVIQINSNGNCLSSDLNSNCNHFDNSNSMPTWIELNLQNGKIAFENNAFDLDKFF